MNTLVMATNVENCESFRENPETYKRMLGLMWDAFLRRYDENGGLPDNFSVYMAIGESVDKILTDIPNKPLKGKDGQSSFSDNSGN